ATPVLPVVGPQVVNELTALMVTNTATESNVHTTVTYSLVNPPAGMTINAAGIISWTPSQVQSPSTNTITTVATGSNALDAVNPVLKATNSFTVVVKEVNVAPVLPAIGSKTVNELTALVVTNTVTEPNIHTTVTYALVNPPAGMSISGVGVISWTPSQTQSPGTNSITTVATGSNPFDAVNPVLKATNSFTVVVKEVNVAPALPVIGLKSVNELAPLVVTNTATEPNIHTTVTYALVSPPGGMTISAGGIISWTPSQAQSPSTNTITTVATGSNAFDTVNPILKSTNTFTVVVREVNLAPVLPVIPIQTVDELTLLVVTNTASEANIHSKVSYALINPPAGASITPNGIVIWPPSQIQSPSTNTITTIAMSSNPFDTVNPVLTATNSFTVVVREVNVAPILPVVPTQQLKAMTLLAVTNTAFEPNIHSKLDYVLISPPLGASIDTNGTILWSPTQNQGGATYTIITLVTATNPYDLIRPQISAANSFTVIVDPANVKPSPPGGPAGNTGVLVTATQMSESEFRIEVRARSGQNYILQASDTLSDGVWTDVQSLTPQSSLFQMFETNPPEGTQRFYRVVTAQ
ncbi:MAG TPA: hypothetical protein VMF06_25440, partial [Candidatus Limnocylindria bacterium]|nr:hypothetical protein [Candidatus Limnocylindria bacterium]